MSVMCTRNIRFLKKGDKGDKGDRGRLPVPYGEYSNSTVYTATDVIAPYVLCEGQYYVMNKTTTWIGASFGNKTPKQDYQQYGANATWILMEQYKAIFVELLMAEFGKIASAIFYGSLMFSQQGIKNGAASEDYESLHTKSNGDVDESVASYFKPNFWINFLNGKMKAISSEITDGKFVNADVHSGKIGGFTLADGWLEAAGQGYGALISAATFKLFSTAMSIYNGTVTANFEAHPYPSAYSMFYILQRLTSAMSVSGSDYSVNNYANILLYLSATGAKKATYNSSGSPYGGNFAAWCDGGMFAGLRPHLRHISSSLTLANTDHTIIVNNSSEITLTLPDNPEIGQVYHIWHVVDTKVIVATANSGTRRYIYRLTATASYDYSHYSTSKECMRLIYSHNLYHNSSNENGMWLLTYDGKSA